jgi:hypothetical protein
MGERGSPSNTMRVQTRDEVRVRTVAWTRSFGCKFAEREYTVGVAACGSEKVVYVSLREWCVYVFSVALDG